MNKYRLFFGVWDLQLLRLQVNIKSPANNIVCSPLNVIRRGVRRLQSPQT